jgi:hypothetical protein
MISKDTRSPIAFQIKFKLGLLSNPFFKLRIVRKKGSIHRKSIQLKIADFGIRKGASVAKAREESMKESTSSFRFD